MNMNTITRLPRTRTAYSTSRRICRKSSSNKFQMPLPLLLVCLLTPFMLTTLWAADTRAQRKSAIVDTWTAQTTTIGRHAPRLHAVGNEFIDVTKENKIGTEKGSGAEEVKAVDKEPIFVPEDVNNPTKIPVPKDGFPPLQLPTGHRNAVMLRKIRLLSQMSPRWPKHPGMHSVELKSYGPAYSSVIISHKLKVIYVPVFKAGTTSMMWNIAYLENNSYVLENVARNPGALDYYLHNMSGPAWQNHTIYTKSPQAIRGSFEDPEYLKFGFVRNPFDRIISAYLDKVLQFDIDRREYQTQMYSLYGDDENMRRLRNATKPTFREYLEAIEVVLAQPRTKSSDLMSRDGFETNKSRRDLHWRPQVELLHPDLVHFDFVGRFEDMAKDREVVLEWIYQHTDRRMPDAGREKMHSTNPVDKIQLYEELRNDHGLKELILKIYRADFERFQFSREVPS